MSAQTITRRLTQADLAKLYLAGEKIVMFTCYDASFARLLDGAGIETMLIGDCMLFFFNGFIGKFNHFVAV